MYGISRGLLIFNSEDFGKYSGINGSIQRLENWDNFPNKILY